MTMFKKCEGSLNSKHDNFAHLCSHLKPDTHDASNHASCLADGDAGTTGNICTCERRLF